MSNETIKLGTWYIVQNSTDTYHLCYTDVLNLTYMLMILSTLMLVVKMDIFSFPVIAFSQVTANLNRMTTTT